MSLWWLSIFLKSNRYIQNLPATNAAPNFPIFINIALYSSTSEWRVNLEAFGSV